jgi:hypothetical protein
MAAVGNQIEIVWVDSYELGNLEDEIYSYEDAI